MAQTLSRQSVSFDFAIQFQKDPVKMPIEDASIVWSEKASPFIRVAQIKIPQQDFCHPAQDAFARNITINPWHTLPELRPLGNQNRARKYIYKATSLMRQKINAEKHIEPTGDEVFDIIETAAKATIKSKQSGRSVKQTGPKNKLSKKSVSIN